MSLRHVQYLHYIGVPSYIGTHILLRGGIYARNALDMNLRAFLVLVSATHALT